MVSGIGLVVVWLVRLVAAFAISLCWKELSDRRAQPGGEVLLADEAVGASRAGGCAASRGIVRRHQDDRRRLRARLNLAGYFQSIDSRQLRVHEHQVRA